MNNKDIQKRYIRDARKYLKLVSESYNNPIEFIINVKLAKKEIDKLYDNVFRY